MELGESVIDVNLTYEGFHSQIFPVLRFKSRKISLIIDMVYRNIWFSYKKQILLTTIGAQA